MLDEKIIGKIEYEGKEIKLKADFKAFKKLQKISGNAFLIIDEFANDMDRRLDHLPLLIKVMADADLTIEEIENNFLGLNYIKVMQMADIILNILNSELANEVKAEVVEETEKN